MIQGNTEAETLRLNGWKVGDILEGDEGFGPDRILITSIGEEQFTCRWMYKGRDVFEKESGNTTLSCRDWRKVDQVQTGEPEAPAWDGGLEEGEAYEITIEHYLSGSKPKLMRPGDRVIFHGYVSMGFGDVCLISDEEIKHSGTIIPSCIRPIRSAEDKAVEELARILSQLPMNASNKSDLASYLYRAIREGKVPGVQLTGGE